VREYTTAAEEETIVLGEHLSRGLSPPEVVLLIGNLGAGKTTLAKGIVHGLTGVSTDDVASPTFTLIHEYGERLKVCHIDLYRLDTAKEVAALGIEDLFDTAICLIEWGERFPELLPPHRIEIRLTAQPDGSRRIVVAEIRNREQ
jgi:tRNA threonylcarbamoyladenosine biosynthesis protein TsaE